MTARPCLGCGRLISTGSRCATCTRTAPTTRRDNSHAERRRRAAAVAQHREAYGDWCPGYGRPPHAATDLTADHIAAVATTGDDNGPLAVLCRSCNSRKGAR
jgi:5-methylcytosine-specific restriction protein A